MDDFHADPGQATDVGGSRLRRFRHARVVLQVVALDDAAQGRLGVFSDRHSIDNSVNSSAFPRCCHRRLDLSIQVKCRVLCSDPDSSIQIARRLVRRIDSIVPSQIVHYLEPHLRRLHVCHGL